MINEHWSLFDATRNVAWPLGTHQRKKRLLSDIAWISVGGRGPFFITLCPGSMLLPFWPWQIYFLNGSFRNHALTEKSKSSSKIFCLTSKFMIKCTKSFHLDFVLKMWPHFNKHRLSRPLVASQGNPHSWPESCWWSAPPPGFNRFRTGTLSKKQIQI